ncbi:hypothetical protein CLOHYLEM_04169 [[Clostridium] hylemonae DSM 15053]|uniref:Uncharacterized protein n=1 Tax=[Clostridium] hylemonae DSM 15053 TaxID=553973 RepID=C0BWI6_9FIRM|nr:hypothetical protein CLOHYLEM_04169 [[Clostridium] hylemonae DSM 15053]
MSVKNDGRGRGIFILKNKRIWYIIRCCEILKKRIMGHGKQK